MGDELRLRLDATGTRLYGNAWESTGHILWITNGEVVSGYYESWGDSESAWWWDSMTLLFEAIVYIIIIIVKN